MNTVTNALPTHTVRTPASGAAAVCIHDVVETYLSRIQRLGRDFPRSSGCGGPHIDFADAIARNGKVVVFVDAHLPSHSDMTEAQAVEKVKQLLEPLLKDAGERTGNVFPVEVSLSLTRPGIFSGDSFA